MVCSTFWEKLFSLLFEMRIRTSRLHCFLIKLALVMCMAVSLIKVLSKMMCPRRTFVEAVARNQTWQSVNARRTAYVFSAYMVDGKVVVHGAISETDARYRCLLWFREGTGESWTAIHTGLTVTAHPESHQRRYKPAVFECPLGSQKRPLYVSIVTDSCRQPTNFVEVQLKANADIYGRKFTVCLAPLHFNYAKTMELIEWIELNRIMGAEKFYIYNYSIHAKVERVLEYYRERGLVDVVQWRLPFTVDTFPDSGVEPEIHYFAQSVALNDCLYRNKGLSEYIVNIDLDEFIVPKKDGVTTWSELLSTINVQNAKAYVFKSCYFRKDWNTDQSLNEQAELTEAKRLGLVTLQVFNREKNVFMKGIRSKYIARTDGVSLVMIHFVLDIPRKSDITASEDVALLHHYRDLQRNESIPAATVRDITVLQKYGKELIQSVKRVRKALS